jgi:hypothetical protein
MNYKDYKKIIFKEVEKKKVRILSSERKDVQNYLWDEILLNLIDSDFLPENYAGMAYEDEEILEYFLSLNCFKTFNDYYIKE